MKKVLCNKGEIITFILLITISIFSVLFITAFIIVGNNFDYFISSCVVIPIIIILFIISTVYLIRKYIKKNGKYIYIEDGNIIYNDIKISLLLLKEIIYEEGYDRPSALYFYLINDQDEMINISKKTVKTIEKELGLEITYKKKVLRKKQKICFEIFLRKII